METSLVLRTCRADLTSRNGFKWGAVGEITTAPDWEPNEECGNGLHGWLFGAGDYSCSNYLGADAVWMVLEVVTADIIMLGGKCKFPSAKTVFAGDRKGASEYLLANEPRSANVEIIGRIACVGDNQSLIGGALSVLTGGYESTLTGGYESTLTGGDRSTLTGGYESTLTGGDRSTLTGGDRSELRIRYWDLKSDRYRTVIAYVGENGILPGVAYRLNDDHVFVAVDGE